MNEGPSPTITLTTDFGTEDGYVAAMKGTILQICPEVQLIDVTHEISPQDVMETAFVLQTARPFFPDNTVHLVVVDPGVGTDRRAVALRHGSHWFVGPDNGVFPLVLNEEPPDAVVELDDPDAWRTTAPSATFHGRDIFAPAAGHLAAGAALNSIGSPLESLEPLRWAEPITDEQTVQGWVIHVDRFGNCITNIRRPTLAAALDRDEESLSVSDLPPIKGYAGNTVVETVRPTYGAVAEGEPLLLFGSTGFLEIAVNSGNAAELLDIRKGDSVKLSFEDAS